MFLYLAHCPSYETIARGRDWALLYDRLFKGTLFHPSTIFQTITYNMMQKLKTQKSDNLIETGLLRKLDKISDFMFEMIVIATSTQRDILEKSYLPNLRKDKEIMRKCIYESYCKALNSLIKNIGLIL